LYPDICNPFPRATLAHWKDLSDWDPVFQLIKDYFEQVDIPITEVQYWRTFVIIVLETRDTDTTKILNQVGNVKCLCLFEGEMGRPVTPKARRLAIPEPGDPDNSRYETLRPGIRLASSDDPDQPGAYLTTSAGIMIRDTEGNAFMTCDT
jgi:hypothetical protein